METWEAVEGSIFPLGATWIEDEEAWNFSLLSLHAQEIVLLVYREDGHSKPFFEYQFKLPENKSGPLWHCRIPAAQIPEAKYYAYRIDGPVYDGSNWNWFDKDKILLDPYAKGVFFPPEFDRIAASQAGANDGKALLGVLSETDQFDWENDDLETQGSKCVIYEMHVRGFTKDPSSGVAVNKRGTFAGVIEKIPYLLELGVTAVELMPVFQFDPQEKNYWGYMTLNFFSPHHKYASSSEAREQRNEFRQMVKALHSAGIEVILDVVYNHTTEGDHRGPNYSFKGIDNSSYYIRWPHDTHHPYANYTGCGNVLNPESLAVQKLVIDSLIYWSKEMHIDGFRFDLASVFARKTDGMLDTDHPPIFGQISSRRGINKTRLIAEPWDAAGTYQLGRGFPGWLWMQWNAKYRDTLQQFVKGDFGIVPDLMTRLYGSCDLFPDDTYHSCRPWQSVNYVSSHDGSTFYDLVTFEEKRNWANGEENRDGSHEHKWNCGQEGDENVSADVSKLRKQQVKNFFALLMLSNGTPMFSMGDEFLKTQGGNNNPYNQDNETSWLDWRKLEDNQDVFRFVKMMIAFRKGHPSIARSVFWRDDVSWHGTITENVDLSAASRAMAYHLRGKTVGDDDLYVMINADFKGLKFNIHAPEEGTWRTEVDTSLASPKDISSLGDGRAVKEGRYLVSPHSVVVLVRDR